MSNQQWYLISRRKIDEHIFCMPCSVQMRHHTSTAIVVVVVVVAAESQTSSAAHEPCLSQSGCPPHGHGSSTDFEYSSDADDNSDDVPT